MIYYHDHPEYRIGDEIQTSALMKYLVEKGHQIMYKDSNQYISAIELFPDNLVTFTSDNYYNNEVFNPCNIWFWSVMLRQKGIYTELKRKHKQSEINLDLVFIPIINPDYNFERVIKIKSALETFYILNKRYSNIKMIIDANKKNLFNLEHPNIIYSNNIYDTFEYIHKCNVFLGTDTGTSHYAGAIKHPKMVLALPDETELKNKVRSHREYIVALYPEEKELLEIEYDAIPCCNPRQFQVIQIANNEIPINETIKAIDKVM